MHSLLSVFPGGSKVLSEFTPLSISPATDGPSIASHRLGPGQEGREGNKLQQNVSLGRCVCERDWCSGELVSGTHIRCNFLLLTGGMVTGFKGAWRAIKVS